MEYGLLGEHLSHSYSPLIHSYLANYSYELIEKSPAELEEFLLQGDFQGLNVTIPYKKAVIPFLCELSPAARKIGSVNTIVKRADGSLYGDNTDYAGFKYTVKRSKIYVKNKKVLVLGSGGASLTVSAVMRDMGAGEVIVISRSGENNYSNIDRHSDADIIVNTTPVGMFPSNDASPVSLKIFKKLSGVIDIIYNPSKTALLLEAKELGIPCSSGLSMLIAQAAYASAVFTGKAVSNAHIEKILKRVKSKTENIVLIGMPGCGKTTIGRRLAKYLGREFIDIDAEIVKLAGKSIPQIFAEDGEEEFRRLETKCAAMAGKKSETVIACGGGIVTRERNKNLLIQNATVIFINRKTNALATKGRPVSAARSLDDIARERIPLYKSWARVTVENVGTSATAAFIIRFLGLKK